jgi:hypothetical protein
MSARKQKSVAGVDQTNLVDPWLLADRDSRFAELFGVPIHYKIAQPPSGFCAPRCYHIEYCTPRRGLSRTEIEACKDSSTPCVLLFPRNGLQQFSDLPFERGLT